MNVTVEYDEEDGTVCITIDPASKDDWSYRDEYGRLEFTVRKPKEGADDDCR